MPAVPRSSTSRADTGDVTQHALSQEETGEVGAIGGHGPLVDRAAIDVIEQLAREPRLSERR